MLQASYISNSIQPPPESVTAGGTQVILRVPAKILYAREMIVVVMSFIP